MRYYAKLSFKRKEDSSNSYILTKKEGQVQNLNLKKYSDGTEYIYFGVPQDPGILKYFAHIFEGMNGPITSTEKVNALGRTFGDTKKLGTQDLILFQFSTDRSTLVAYFLKDLGTCRAEKTRIFEGWCKGEKLEPEYPKLDIPCASNKDMFDSMVGHDWREVAFLYNTEHTETPKWKEKLEMLYSSLGYLMQEMDASQGDLQ